MKLRILALTVLSALSVSASANETLDEIKKRCKSDMGQYGASLVKTCIDMDLAVIDDLNKFSTSHKNTYNRCMRDMRSHGFNLVHTCITMDVEAQKAIDNY